MCTDCWSLFHLCYRRLRRRRRRAVRPISQGPRKTDVDRQTSRRSTPIIATPTDRLWSVCLSVRRRRSNMRSFLATGFTAAAACFVRTRQLYFCHPLIVLCVLYYVLSFHGAELYITCNSVATYKCNTIKNECLVPCVPAVIHAGQNQIDCALQHLETSCIANGAKQ